MWERNYRCPDGTCKSNDYVSVVNLWILNRIQNSWQTENTSNTEKQKS